MVIQNLILIYLDNIFDLLILFRNKLMVNKFVEYVIHLFLKGIKRSNNIFVLRLNSSSLQMTNYFREMLN